MTERTWKSVQREATGALKEAADGKTGAEYDRLIAQAAALIGEALGLDGRPP